MFYTTEKVGPGDDPYLPNGGEKFVRHDGPNPDFQKSAMYKEGLTADEKKQYDDLNTSEDDRSKLEQKANDTYAKLHPETRNAKSIDNEIG
jgi:hypothetical protein